MIKKLLSRLKSQKGFTLLELLIVISIIGILATLVVVNLGGARGSARDAQRMSDLKTIQTALESYFNDYGCYPAPGGSTDCLTGGNWDTSAAARSNDASSWSSLEAALSRYLPQLPVDPSDPNMHYTYTNVGKSSQPVGYDLIAILETNHEASCGRIIVKYSWGFNKEKSCGDVTEGDGDKAYIISERLSR